MCSSQCKYEITVSALRQLTERPLSSCVCIVTNSHPVSATCRAPSKSTNQWQAAARSLWWRLVTRTNRNLLIISRKSLFLAYYYAVKCSAHLFNECNHSATVSRLKSFDSSTYPHFTLNSAKKYACIRQASDLAYSTELSRRFCRGPTKR